MIGRRALALVATLPCLPVSVLAVVGSACGGAAATTQAPAAANAPAAASSTSPAAAPESTASALPPPTAAADAKPEVKITPPNAEGNPFAGGHFYIDHGYVTKVEATAKTDPADAATLKKVEAFPTAIWLSSIKDTAGVAKTLEDAAAQQKKNGQPVVTTFVVYDLPERDCAAVASNGELTIAKGGEKRYQKEFIDKIAAAFKTHAQQRVVVVLEPDSLANLATNLSVPKCAAAQDVYKHSISYAIKTLALPNVTIYLDGAHAGWLGWSANREKIAALYAEVLKDAGGPDKIRGFATNVSNYDSLKDGDLAKLEPSDPAKGELDYIELLDQSLTAAGIVGKAFVIDTGRNGRSGIKTKSGSWCNIKGAGLGERPQVSPAPLVDAYLWIKPPGESDGGGDPKKPGFDDKCGPDAPDAAKDAPRAGEWFGSYFIDLAKNANPPL
jgi:cellulose 1,4-beta-cellobiosidase